MNNDEIELKGDAIESFERLEGISEVVLLGRFGGVRRILLVGSLDEDTIHKIKKDD